MEPTITPVTEITRATKRWTAKVILVQKFSPKLAANNSGQMYQRLIFSDATGGRVQATIFNKDIERLKDRLVQLKQYYISNAVVNPIPASYQMVPNPNQWTISARTLIREVPERRAEKFNDLYNFVSFTALQKPSETNESIDAIGVVLDILDPRTVSTAIGFSKLQEIILIDKEFKPVSLTFWDDFVDNECKQLSKLPRRRTIVAALRVKAALFRDLGFSSKPSSSFIINPNLPEAILLKSWAIEEDEKLQSIAEAKLYLQESNKRQIIPANKIVALKCAEDMPPNSSFWTKAGIIITDVYQKFWYMACNKCINPTEASFEEVFDCNFCSVKNCTAIPRCRIEVELVDSTTSLTVNIFGEKAEKLFSCTAVQLMQETGEDGIVDSNAIPNTEMSKIYLIKLKAPKDQGNEAKYKKPTIVGFQEDGAIVSTDNTGHSQEQDVLTGTSSYAHDIATPSL